MYKVQVLDCTLRDGGYINQWKFSWDIIKKTLESLVKTNIDIIELGFLTNSHEYDKDITLFDSIEEAINLVDPVKSTSTFVLMINHGEYDLNNLSESNNFIGLRYAFHKHDLHEVMKQSKIILQKGYKLFLQPMVINAYTSKEISTLIEIANEIQPYALYIVDSFGVLSPNDVIKYAKRFDSEIKESIIIGFHSHNNKQFSMANSVAFIDCMTRDIIIDSSIYGMGRGAGNLNTEIIVDYINRYQNHTYYKSLNLLEIIDNYYHPLQVKTPWGYSLPFYLSAKHALHPNYAKHLIDLDTLGIEEVEQILETISVKDRVGYNSKLIQQKYIAFQSSKRTADFEEVEPKLGFSKDILIILPGKSHLNVIGIMNDCSKAGYTLISVNFVPNDVNVNYIFVTNTKRIHQVKASKLPIIRTSNIDFDFENQEILRYSEHINNLEYVNDNALLMLLSFLKQFNLNQISIAGLDGYNPLYTPTHSYFTENTIANDNIVTKNNNIARYLEEFREVVEINLITSSKFIKFN